jgi:flagellar basal body-associated protein FliL
MSLVNPMFDPPENKWPDYPEGNTELHYRRKSKAVWVVVVALIVALGASAYYGYFSLKEHNVQISWLFGSQAALNALGQRTDAAESKLRELTGGWESLGQRVTNLESLEGKVAGNLKQTRKYAEALTQRLHQQLSAELEARSSGLDARIRQVESEQTAQRFQMERVQAELKQDVASVREETGRDLSGVHQQGETNARDLSALSQRLARERVDFELAKGQTQEVVPGVSLRISGTNPMYQRYRGSLWLLQDRRTLWLRDQSVHQPVRFFHKETGEPYELVVTDVTKKFVIGYMLVPVPQETAVGALPDQRAAIGTSGRD